MDSVELDQLVLLEVNYQYENQLGGDGTRPPLCLLLLGCHLDDHEKFEIQRSLITPLQLQVIDNQDGEFVYNLDQVLRRIRLIRETNPQLQLCGIMVINNQIYDYDKPIESLMRNFKGQIKYLFTYEPDLNAEISRKLNGFTLFPRKQRIGYRLQHGRVNVESQKIDANTNPLNPHVAERQCLDQQEAFTEKLIHEIDKMIGYLDHGQPSDAILRKISMLVSQLNRGPTTDIEEAIMNKENELNVLRTVCEQWEMGIELSD